MTTMHTRGRVRRRAARLILTNRPPRHPRAPPGSQVLLHHGPVQGYVSMADDVVALWHRRRLLGQVVWVAFWGAVTPGVAVEVVLVQLGVVVLAIGAGDLGVRDRPVPQALQGRRAEAWPLAGDHRSGAVCVETLALAQGKMVRRSGQRRVPRDALLFTEDVSVVLSKLNLGPRGQALARRQTDRRVLGRDVLEGLDAHERQPAPVLVWQELHRHGLVVVMNSVHNALSQRPAAVRPGAPALHELQLLRHGGLLAAVDPLDAAARVVQPLLHGVVVVPGLELAPDPLLNLPLLLG
mmetsp:Transcript_68543/g.198901  ORF Transcript_68543/g.198901 Transcript_68543/m.198901 type:complete len:295 (-) Transcript_68543:182-1066(-)